MEGMEILQYAKEQKNEELLYFRWLLGYEKYISFDEFKENAVKVIRQVRPKSQKEILSKVEDILEMRVE